jgi:cell wall assembly regulator SMI1
MTNHLEERIRRAVIDGYEARSYHYATVDPDMADEQQLGSPAPESRIVDLETGLGRPLPPSYRAFLSMYNGWRMGVSGATDLLSVEEMLDGPRAERVREWRQLAQKLAQKYAGDEAEVVARALVIGVSDVTPTRVLLDPETIDANGEWRLVEYYYGVEQVYPSFLSWLEATVEEFRQLAENPEAFE